MEYGDLPVTQLYPVGHFGILTGLESSPGEGSLETSEGACKEKWEGFFIRNYSDRTRGREWLPSDRGGIQAG